MPQRLNKRKRIIKIPPLYSLLFLWNNTHMKTTCSKCQKQNDRLPQRYCKACHAENMRNTRPKHADLPEDSRKRANARAYINVYVKRGKVIKLPCEACGEVNSEKHHEDYDKPLDVRWLCRKCHLEHHAK